MADSCSEKPSKIPQHLIPFLRPSFTTEPVVTQIPYSYTLRSQTSPPRTVELCPPHWRPPPKRSLRRKLKDILLQDWQSVTPKTPRRSTTSVRPLSMRMKDSDDYITARAANPRTGLISPSICGTPRPTATPSSPGEALQRVVRQGPPSPTPEAKARPSLRRANEARKMSGRSTHRWRPGDSGFVTEIAVSVASPQTTHANADAGLVYSRSQPLMHEDKLLVHMPSAREPQPYAYPGYSAKQIAAFEHYKRKTRRVSSEGYDQRILSTVGQTWQGSVPNTHGIPVMSACDIAEKSVTTDVPGITREKENPKPMEENIKVAKMRSEARGLDYTVDRWTSSADCYAGAELKATDFAPYSSPRTPDMRHQHDSVSTLGTISKANESRADILHVRRKPVAPSPGAQLTSSDGQKTDNSHFLYAENIPVQLCDPSPSTDLRHLPRIALVHPVHASLPRALPHRQAPNAGGERKCSLGCNRNMDGDTCVNRLPSVDTVPSTKRALFEGSALVPNTNPSNLAVNQMSTHSRDLDEQHSVPQLLEVLVTGIISMVDSCRHVHVPVLPRIGALEILRAEETTPQQKVDALKTIWSSTGQVLIFLTIMAVLWQVGSALTHLCEVFFWPLLVPFKMLQWLAGT